MNFHFYSECQAVHHNTFGGIMSILFVLICIFLFIEIELDDLCKSNPISSKSEINHLPGISNENLDDKILWIPFRMVTYDNKYIDHRGFLYPVIYFVKGIKNSEGVADLKYTKLNYKLCNETSMNNKSDNYIINAKLNELYCINDEFSLIDSSWNEEEVYFLQISLYICKNGINYNENNPDCTSFTELLNYYNTSWIFEYFYPVVQFKPADKKIPIDIIYKSNYYRLSRYTSKVDRLYLKQNILSDGQSLFSSKSTITSFWGATEFFSDNYFLPTVPDSLLKETNSRLYTLVISKDQGLIYYTRSYKKILAILSDIFPMWNIIFIIFNELIKKIKETFLKRSLMKILFEQTNTATNNKLKRKRSSPNILLKINKLNIINNNNRIKNDKRNIDNSLNKMKLSSCFYLNEAENKSNFFSLNISNNLKNNKSVIFNKKKLNIQKINNDSIKNIIKSVKNYELKNLFPFSYYLMDVFLDNLDRPDKFRFVSSKYLIVYNFMSQIYDISTYIQLFRQFNILKTTVNFAKIFENDNNWKININKSVILQKLKDINIESKKLKSSTALDEDLFIFE